MKSFNRIIVYGFIFLIGLAFGWVVKGKHIQIIFTIYLPALVTLFAAYLGAKYAFDLHDNREKDEIKNKNIANGNLAIFDITRMINTLLSYQQQTINPVGNKPTTFLEMRPTLNIQ